MEGKRILAAISGSQFSALRRILEPEGYTLNLTATGASAQALVRSFHPDVVLLSVNLPDMSGIDVCRSIKVDHKTAHIPVIFYTPVSSITALTRRLAETAGAFATLTFGISDQHLLSTIASSLQRGEDELPEKRPA